MGNQDPKAFYEVGPNHWRSNDGNVEVERVPEGFRGWWQVRPGRMLDVAVQADFESAARYANEAWDVVWS